MCAPSDVVMLDTPYSEVMWRLLATHSIRQFPLYFLSRASPCAITFQLESTKVVGLCLMLRVKLADLVLVMAESLLNLQVWMMEWLQWSVNLPLLTKLPTCLPCLPHHIYLHLHKSSTVPVLLAISITAEQQSAVNCWTQHVNKYVQLSSSASGRCHTDRALCLIWAVGNSWFVGWSKYTVWIAL